MEYNLKYINLLHRGFINDKRKKRSTKLNRSSNVRRISPTRPFIKEN